MNEPTDREYELENELWNTLWDVQQYMLARIEGRTEVNTFYWKRLQGRIQRWMQDPEKWLKHPKWEETTESNAPNFDPPLGQ